MGGIPWSSEGPDDPLELLKFLHGKLRTDDGASRARIDAHLLACYVSPKNPDPRLVLAPEDTFHYHNLPDLSNYLRQALACGDWGSNLVSSFMAVYCFQVKKQKRSYRFTRLVERAALVNLLHGLLLGLYPYNTHHCTFEHRVAAVGAIREVMTSDGMLDFILQHDSLIQFAMVEYLSNVVPDFMPVEEALLVRGQQSRFSINQVCESFRVSAAPLYEGPNLWAALNDLAASNISSLFRQLKACNAKVSRAPAQCRASSGVWNSLSKDEFYTGLLDLPLLSLSGANNIAQIKILCPGFSFEELQAVEFFWSNVFLSNLPAHSYQSQVKVLAKHGSCQTYQRALSHIHVCFVCALKTKSPILGQKFAYNCTQRIMQCASCSRVASTVNMMGRILRVRDTSYHLCQWCLRPTSGGLLQRCKHCAEAPERQDLSCCVVCSKKTFEVIHKVLDLDTLRIAHTPLCFHHARHGVMSQSTVYDTKSLLREFCSG